ncbi:MAG: hypothetical protein OSA07_10245 [Pseudomonadales bacterium]|nr:hypothetical protein [Pseudomonadales bacterium]
MTDTKPNIIEGPTDDGFDSVLSQSLSDDLHRDILTLTSRLISNTAHTNDLHIVDRGIYSLMESLVVIAKTYSESEEELDEMIDSYMELMNQIVDKSNA